MVPEIINPDINIRTISSSDLKVSHDIWDLFSGGEKYKSVYANYQWYMVSSLSGFHRTFNDKIGIAVPSGWEVQAQSYRCAEFQSGTGPGNGTQKGNCNGGTYSLNYYGAAWELTGTDKVWHNGWVNLNMKRISSSAQNKVISTYAADYTSGGSITFGVQWGPLTLSFTPNSSSSDQVAWDTPFTY